MTKKKVASFLAETHGLEAKLAQDLVDSLFDELANRLRDGNKISIRGFGVFAPRTRPAHVAKDPRNHRKVHVPERLAVTFKASRSLRLLEAGGELTARQTGGQQLSLWGGC